MDTIIIVVAIGLLIAMVVMMFRYAGFIHRFPHQDEKGDEKDKKPGAPSQKDHPEE